MPAYICALWYVKLLLQFKARGVRKCIPEYNTEIIQTQTTGKDFFTIFITSTCHKLSPLFNHNMKYLNMDVQRQQCGNK